MSAQYGKCWTCGGYCSLAFCSPRCHAVYHKDTNCRDCGKPAVDWVFTRCRECSDASLQAAGIDIAEYRKDHDAEGRCISTSDYHKDRR